MKSYHIIFDPNHNFGKQCLRIHKAGCRDVALEIMRSENNWKENAETPMDAIKDELEDQGYEPHHVKVCGCCD